MRSSPDRNFSAEAATISIGARVFAALAGAAVIAVVAAVFMSVRPAGREAPFGTAVVRMSTTMLFPQIAGPDFMLFFPAVSF
jgi:hypothetical protein